MKKARSVDFSKILTEAGADDMPACVVAYTLNYKVDFTIEETSDLLGVCRARTVSMIQAYKDDPAYYRPYMSELYAKIRELLKNSAEQ